MDDTEKVLTQAIAWREAGLGVALATVVSTWGSSPRPVGSRLAANDAGRFSGSVSGGCVEAAIIETAQTVIRTGKPELLEFGVSDADAWSVGLPCGGAIQIFLERLE